MAHWVRVTVCCRRSDRGWAIAHEHVSLPIDTGQGGGSHTSG
jgi:ketosteroid isomerase-like protein